MTFTVRLYPFSFRHGHTIKMWKFGLILLSSFLPFLPAEAQVAVIANQSVPVDTIDKIQVLDFYTKDIKKWNSKTPVVVLDLKPDNEIKETFYKFLGKSTSRMKSIWLKKMLSGEGDPPEAMSSHEEMVKKVAETPGAIGFADRSKIKGKEDIKILLVINDR